MKSLLSIICVLALMVLTYCSQKSDHDQMNHGGDTAAEEGSNEALYNQMMNVHDEVMPQMDEIMKLKRTIQEEISNTPDLVTERKQQLEMVISNLDSASNAMMDWMHRIHAYDPMADTIDQEKSREFLETEMERIRKVKGLMRESIDKAKENINNPKFP